MRIISFEIIKYSYLFHSPFLENPIRLQIYVHGIQDVRNTKEGSSTCLVSLIPAHKIAATWLIHLVTLSSSRIEEESWIKVMNKYISLPIFWTVQRIQNLGGKNIRRSKTFRQAMLNTSKCTLSCLAWICLVHALHT